MAMRRMAFVVFIIFMFAGCVSKNAMIQTGGMYVERHMKNVTQLTFDGDNGEAYFSPDGLQLIYQSNREGYACDKIWIMNIDGSNKHMVSPGHGAHTCSYFFPDG